MNSTSIIHRFPRCKTILQIARNELALLFCSPVAWLVLAVFIFRTGIVFADLLQEQISAQASGSGSALSLSGNLFYRISGGGFFNEAQDYFYFYIPLLTMGLISRETSSGSIKLLISSPLRIPEIVLGKYVAICGFCLSFVFILAIPVGVTMIEVPHADVGLLVTGLFGFFLIACAYSAIGLFLSSLTSYPVIAGISTFIVLALLHNAGSLFQDVEYLRQVTFYLGMKEKLEGFLRGMISSAYLVYFGLINVLFIGFTILVLLSKRNSDPWLDWFRRYSIWTVCVGVIAWLSFRPTHIFYRDTTQRSQNTLTVNSIAVLKQIHTPLHIHDYVNVLDYGGFHYGLPENRNAELEYFEPYQRFLSAPIKFDYTYYYDSTKDVGNEKSALSLWQRAEIACLASGFNANKVARPEVVRASVDLASRGRLYTRELEANGSRSLISRFDNQETVEADMITAIKLLTVSQPVIGMLTGHGERTLEGRGPADYHDRLMEYSDRRTVVNQGFRFEETGCDSPLAQDRLVGLLIADPVRPFSVREMSVLEDYIRRGGNLLIAAEPDRREILRPLVRKLGIDFVPGELVRRSKHYPPNFLVTHFAPEAAALSPQISNYFTDGVNLTTTGAMALTYADTNGFVAKPFILTDSSTVTAKGLLPVAVTLTRMVNSRQQRIVVMGDADYLSNGQLGFSPMRVNGHLGEEIFRWFSYGLFPVDTYRPRAVDTRLALSDRGITVFRGCFEFLLPLVLVVAGAVFLLRRRNY